MGSERQICRFRRPKGPDDGSCGPPPTDRNTMPVLTGLATAPAGRTGDALAATALPCRRTSDVSSKRPKTASRIDITLEELT